ncbi:hypothetical protein D3C72_2309980 [compost metagenome]
MLRKHLQRLQPVLRFEDAIRPFLQMKPDELPDIRLVFRNQYVHVFARFSIHILPSKALKFDLRQMPLMLSENSISDLEIIGPRRFRHS